MTKKATAPLLLRILLDVVMILLAITLFSKNAISLLYHEVAALVLIALFVLHLILNRKWIAALFTAKKARPARLTFMTALNALLTLSWLAVLVTGVLVSKKVFALQIHSLNPWHFFCSSVALLLTGIHLGMHWSYFWSAIKKAIPLPRVIAILLAVAVIGFGCFSLYSSSYLRWISAPFRAQQTHDAPQSAAARNAENTAKPETAQNAAPTDGEQARSAAPAGEGGQAASQNRGGRTPQPFSFARLLNVIATNFSLIFLFASAAHGVDLLAHRKKPRPKA